jgi:diacylglycerol kinase family enzyme
LNQAEATGGAGDPAGKVATCLLINPLSCRTLYGDLARKAELLARAHGLRVEVSGDPPRILELLDELRAQRVARLFVLSGDGTIQLIARYLADLPPGDWNPELLLLGGGRANVVPRAFGGTPALPALRRVLQAVRAQRPLQVELQPVMCVSQEGRPVQRGFILVGAMIDFGVRYCRDWRAAGTSWWHRGILADQISLLRLAALSLTGRSPAPAAPQLVVRMQPVGTLYAPVRVLVAGVLHDAGGHYNPYASRGDGPLRLTAVAAEAPRFWRNLPRMLTGRFDDQTMNVEQGYLSGHCQAVTVDGLSTYSLDGEPFDADPSLPLRISTGHVLNVLRA